MSPLNIQLNDFKIIFPENVAENIILIIYRKKLY